MVDDRVEEVRLELASSTSMGRIIILLTMEARADSRAAQM